jgi:hypothetical protein
VSGPGEPARLDEEPPDQLLQLPVIGEAIDARGRLLQWAAAQQGEQDPHRYTAIAAPQFNPANPHSFAWCGIFALAGLIEAGIASGHEWLWRTGEGFLQRRDGAGRLWLPRTGVPQSPGDIMLLPGPSWHHCIVHSWADGYCRTLDGNTLPYPKEGVAARRRPILGAFGFYSLARLLGEAV